MSWLDEQLSWNPRDYGGIDTISLPEGQYWTPDLEKPFHGACGDRAQDELFKIENVTLTSEGKILLSVYKQLGALCIVDMTYYPFDKHTCIHQFYSTKYAHNELAVNFLNEIIIGEIYKENQEWKVSKTESYVVNLTLDRMSVAYASNHITIERRPSFILISKFLPAVLLMILHLSVPLVPPDSERLSFATTTYLALLFINISFISDMPRNSIKIIMLSYFLLASNAIATLEVIWSIFIVCLSNTPTSKRKVPKFLLGLLEVKDKEVTPLKDEENDMDKPAKTADKLKDIGWYEVSRYLDKVYFIVSLFLVTIMFAVMVYIFNDMK
ncbi:neuronal acetylcholine receptor subunit alpha-3-like [Mercenaria mercenaria]|uniref:neuronal acetylcholine receptor subunit alpha-3-like n=1 Tax=Mercenaria mercenaria TaxID=6596 RepID=UPI00234FB517|nr:neuronal acetylcholine receptor subunit alpha-3-like [Mercenaria mercenaria]